jgi:hypothetical protein
MNVDRGSGVPSLIATIVMDKEYWLGWILSVLA